MSLAKQHSSIWSSPHTTEDSVDLGRELKAFPALLSTMRWSRGTEEQRALGSDPLGCSWREANVGSVGCGMAPSTEPDLL